MKTIRILTIILGTLAFGINSSLAEEKEELGFDISAGYYGKYIWRGQNIDDEPVFQPGISANYQSFFVSIWGNIETTSINDKSGDLSEVDYTLGYSNDLPGIEKVRFSVGIIYYDFHSCTIEGVRCPDTTELYWGLNLDLPLNPSMTVYRDLDEADGAYVSFSAGHSIEKIAEFKADIPVGMELGAALGWGNKLYDKYYWGANRSKLNDLAFSVSFPLAVAGWTAKPSLSYITLLSDDIRDSDVYGTDSDFFVAGISLLKSF